MKHLHYLLVLATLLLTISTANAFHYEYGGNTYNCTGYDDGTARASIKILTTPNLVVPPTAIGEDKRYKITYFNGAAVNGVYDNNQILKTVELPSSVQSLREKSFARCTALTSASCPNVQTIKLSTFNGCSALTSISCPKVQLIDNYAFKECSALINVTFPNLQSIGVYAFYNCSALTNISCPNLNTIGMYAFYNCSALTNISLPNLQSIGVFTFAGCTSLTSISFTKIKLIQSWVFVSCPSIKSIEIDNEEPPTAYYNTFDSITYETARLYVPKAAIEKYKNTEPWCRFYITSEMENYNYTDLYESETRRDVEVKGVTADGMSQLLIVEKDFPKNYSLSDFSVVVKINGEEVKDEKLIGDIGELKYLKKDEVGFVYTAPDGYAGPDNSSSYTLEIELTPSDEQKQLHARVEVWRPGVLMLHGLNDNSFKCWNDAVNYLLNTGSYTRSQINNASYESSNRASFHDNTYRYRIVEKNLNALYDQLKAGGIVSSRYDLVGHSMGGILSRKYAQEINHDAVNRILTFNTPHSGSQLGEISNSAVDIMALVTAIKSPKIAFALKTFADNQIEAVYDLGVNSEANRILNDRVKINNAYGILVHAACTAFDGVAEKIEEKNPYTTAPFSTIKEWLTGFIKHQVGTPGLGVLNSLLQDEQHDGVVPLVSQRGGLPLGSSASLLTDKYPRDGYMGFNSNAHHCMMPHWSANHERLISLLRAQKDDPRFAKSFAPVDLSSKAPRQMPELKTEEARPESFIRLTATRVDSDSRLVNISLEASDDVVNKGAFCIIDEDRMIVSDFEDECTFSIPSEYDGKLEVIAVGYTSYNAWVTDVAELDFEGAVTPYCIRIEGCNPLALSEGETVEPQVTVFWPDGEQTTVKADFELVDSDGEAEIIDGLLNGLHEGSCRLIATYREMTDTIPVLVMKGLSGVDEITVSEESGMKLFRRDNHIVVKMLETYDGTLDFEVFDIDGRLIAHNITGGNFTCNEEIMFGLPERNGSFLIVRCRREDDKVVTMKILD